MVSWLLYLLPFDEKEKWSRAEPKKSKNPWWWKTSSTEIYDLRRGWDPIYYKIDYGSNFFANKQKIAIFYSKKLASLSTNNQGKNSNFFLK